MAGLGGAGAVGWGSFDDDDWGLSEEQLDKLEQDAYRKLAERKAASFSTPPATSPLPNRALPPAITASAPLRNDHPACRVSLESRFGKVESLSPSRPSQPNAVNNSQGSSPKISVHLFLHSSGVIAAKFPYHQKLVDVFHKIPKATWNGKERVWMFPPTSLSIAEEVLNAVPGLAVEVESLSPSRLSQPNAVNNSQGSSPKISVHLFLNSSGLIAAKFPYHQKLVDAFHKIPKASWNGKERVWMFPPASLSLAVEVLNAVPGLAVEVQKLDPLVQQALATALAVKDLRGLYDRIPTDVESKLMPFQRAGVRFALQHGGRVLIADEMGLGKTLQALGVASCLHDAWPVLVISPSSLQLHWATEIRHWLNIPTEDILVVLPQTRGSNKAGFRLVYSNTKGDLHLDGVFNIISYDVVPKIQSTLLNLDFKIVIADESHFMKNGQANRTIASLPVLQKAQYVVLLSGTPALSCPIELFTQLQALYPTVYKNVNEYGNRYCRGGHFGLYQGASNHEELHNLMKATVMIRRLKKDVLSELPVKRRQQVFLDLSENETNHIRPLFRELETVKIKIQSCDSTKMATLKLSEKKIINKIYNNSVEAKIPAVLDYLDTVIEADYKFLIFAHHQRMIDPIHQHLLKKKVNCIKIDGQTPVAVRQTLATDFQNKDDIKAAVLSIKAGGVGLALTAASTVIFAELSWTPGDIIQAEDRAHRIGQVSSVNIYYLLANDTVDDIIWDVVQGKLENLGQMLDGQAKTLDVSQSETRPSPSKHKTLDSYVERCDTSTEAQPNAKDPTQSEARPSPSKQKTLDSYFKRCNTSTETQPNAKKPRFSRRNNLAI